MTLESEEDLRGDGRETRMVLGIHYHQPALLDSNGIRMTYALGVFIDSLAPYFEQVHLLLHGPTAAERDKLNYYLTSRNIRLVQLGGRKPVYWRVIMAPYYSRTFKRESLEIDVMLFRVSTVLLPFVAGHFRRRVLYFVSHSSRGVENLPQHPFRLFWIKLWTQYYASRELAIARSSCCIANNLELKLELEDSLGHNVDCIPSTTLSESDIRPPVVRPLGKPIRVLCVGRVSFEKGVLDLIEAVHKVRTSSFDLELVFAGTVSGGDAFRKELLACTERLHLTGAVRFLGFVDGGESLWKIYRESDLLVVASRESEGFPRVIWEAMANSVPVVATSVGGIPMLGRNAIELVPAKNPSGLAVGMMRILSDPAYRMLLVERGYRLVSSNTLERRGLELAHCIRAS